MNEEIFWNVFEVAISVLENVLLLGFCLDFMQQRPEGKKGKLLFGIAVLIGMVFPALEAYPSFYDQWEIVLTFCWLSGYLAISTRGSIWRKMLAAVLARAMVTLINTAIAFCGSLLLRQSVASFIQQQDTMRILLVLMTKIVYFFAGKGINSLLFERKKLVNWQWVVLLCSLAFSVFAGDSMIVLARDLPEVQMREQKWMLLCVGCIWLMCLLLYFVVQQMSKDNQIKLEYELMKEKEKYSQESMELIRRSNEELREFKHDLKNYLLPIQEMAKTSSRPEISEAWANINQKIEDVQTLIQTGNIYVDSMVNTKLSIARNEKIDVKCTILGEINGIDGMEFCSVFGNLMDNAIEAEKELADGRKIFVFIEEKMGYLRLQVKNRIKESVLQENADLQTTKNAKEEHGFGHKSVKRIMQKMGGTIRYYEKEDLFCAEAVFPVKET